GARSTNSLEPSEEDGAESLLDKLLHTGNLNSAYKRVKQNRGASYDSYANFKEWGYVKWAFEPFYQRHSTR
ncbi:hypothetical protein CDO51_13320, partial [Natranaerobius trueperi]